MKQRWTHWYLLTMAGIFPLWLGWEGYGDLTAQKFAFFAVAASVWLAGLAALTLREGRQKRNTGPARPWVLALMAALCLSALCSPYGAATVLGPSRYDGLITWLLYGGIFLGVTAYGRPRLSQAYALAAGAVVNCAVAVIQLLGYNCLWLFPAGWTYYDSGVYYTGAFLGFIGNTDVLAAYFCLVIPMCFGLYVLCGGRKTAWLLPAGALSLFVLLESGVSGGLVGLLLCVLIGAPLILTDTPRLSRGLQVLSLAALTAAFSAAVQFSAAGAGFKLCKLSLLLLAAACLLALAAHRLRKHPITLCKLPCTILLLELLCIAAALTALYLHPPAEGTLYELSRLLHGEVSDTFGSRRVEIWRNVWQLVKERPLLGGGPGTLELRTDLEFSRFVSESGRTLRVHLDNAHNEYLNLLVNGGVLSLLPYLGLMAATLRRAVRTRGRPAACVLLLPLIAWWGQGFFGLGLCIVMPLMWAMWGLFWTVDDNNIM